VSNRVLKHRLTTSVCKIETSEYARVLSVQEQDGEITLWVLDHVDGARRNRTFRQVMTGQVVPPRAAIYHGTVVMHEGAFVAHVFEDVAT
jgi:hypothetical protein